MKSNAFRKTAILFTRNSLIKIATLTIKAYQYLISPVLGKNCRHHPSCSSYCIESLNKHGFLKGFILTVARILRCNPWSLGGFDPVPEAVSFKKLSSFKIMGNYKTELYHSEQCGHK